MCGIAGIMRFDGEISPADRLWMAATLGRLERRGPDSQACLEINSGCVLGAARLRITDPHNAEADQPFLDIETGNVIVFNGQIYNHAKLRAELPTGAFRTRSDTETLLSCYREWGARCVERCEGMFAFAVWNEKHQALDLAVDPTRQKPLFYLSTAEVFAFSSELETLLSIPGICCTLNREAVNEAIAFRMNIAPATHWREISKLVPGTLLRAKRAGGGSSLRYFHVPLPDPKNEDDALIEGARADTEISCRETVTTEHKTAVLLSGGVDSSVVAALVASAGGAPLAVSIGFERAGESHEIFDEFEHSTAVASRLGIEHCKITLSSDDYSSWLQKWLDIAEEPFSSLEAICLLRIFDELHRRGIKVAYTGTGPDEMLDGYRLGILISQSAEDDVAERFFERFALRGMTDLGLLLGPAYPAARESIIRKINLILEPYDSCGLSVSEQVQIINSHVHLPEYEHRQMDFSSMNYGIEARNPLCSRRLIDRWFSATDDNRTCPTQEKFIWKKVAEKYVDQSIAWRKKAGFPVPAYVKQDPVFEALIDDMLGGSSTLCTEGFVDAAYAHRIRSRSEDEYRRIFFRLILLNRVLSRQRQLTGKGSGPSTNPYNGLRWYRRHMLSGGDGFACVQVPNGALMFA